MNDLEPTRDDASALSAGQRKALSWLTSDQLKQTILSSTADIQDVLMHTNRDGRSGEKVAHVDLGEKRHINEKWEQGLTKNRVVILSEINGSKFRYYARQ